MKDCRRETSGFADSDTARVAHAKGQTISKCRLDERPPPWFITRSVVSQSGASTAVAGYVDLRSVSSSCHCPIASSPIDPVLHQHMSALRPHYICHSVLLPQLTRPVVSSAVVTRPFHSSAHRTVRRLSPSPLHLSSPSPFPRAAMSNSTHTTPASTIQDPTKAHLQPPFKNATPQDSPGSDAAMDVRTSHSPTHHCGSLS